MATPKKLPSGQWRTLVFSHYDFLTDDKGHPVIDPKTGKQKTKRIYESFTADTKKESAFMAAEYQMNKKRIQNGDLTVKEAMEEYIKTKRMSFPQVQFADIFLVLITIIRKFRIQNSAD